MRPWPHTGRYRISTIIRTRDLTKRASESVRTLHSYDREGLLSPSHLFGAFETEQPSVLPWGDAEETPLEGAPRRLRAP